MGSAMARNLIRAGYEVVVFNRSRAPVEALAKEGAIAADQPAKAPAGREIVITILANDEDVESTILGPGGVIEDLPTGALHVSMSTISPALSQRLATAHEER